MHIGPSWIHPLRSIVLALGCWTTTQPISTGNLRQKARRVADLGLRASTRLLRPPARALLRSADGVRSWDWLWQPTYGRRWQEHFYHDHTDPYGCTINPYEQHKYRHALDLMAGCAYPSALEIGCSEGVFTAMVAPQCTEVLAIDLSEHAVERAKARLSRFDHVSVMRATLPMEMPPGAHDLILCLDVLYYLPRDVLIDFLPHLKAALAPGGMLLSLHYLGNFGQAMRGKEVHDLLVARLGIEVTYDEVVPDVGPREAGYRVTCLEVPAHPDERGR